MCVSEIERKLRKLKPANEFLLAASSFFARKLDLRLPWKPEHAPLIWSEGETR